MISIDWENKVVESTASITDLPAFKDTIRDLEDDAEGMLYSPVIIYKKVIVGSGALHAVDFINGYRLKFIGAGPFVITGNLNATIIPTGVQIEREKSLSFVTVASDGGGGSSSFDTAALHNGLDSYTNKDDWKATSVTVEIDAEVVWTHPTRTLTEGSGLDEEQLHTALDSYTNKDDWKATNTAVDLTPVVNAINALNNLSLAQIEGSNVLAKTATLTTIANMIAQIPTTDSVADLTPVLNAIGALNDVTPAEVRAAFNAAEFKDKNTELEMHTWLDSYANKASWKSDVTIKSDDKQMLVNAIWGQIR